MEINDSLEDDVQKALSEEIPWDEILKDDDEERGAMMNCIEKAEKVISALTTARLECCINSQSAFPKDGKLLLQVLRAASAMGRPDVSEVYPPPRVVPLAEKC